MPSKVLTAVGQFLEVPLGTGVFEFAIKRGFSGTIELQRKLVGEDEYGIIASYTTNQELVGDCGADGTKFRAFMQAYSSGSPLVSFAQVVG